MSEQKVDETKKVIDEEASKVAQFIKDSQPKSISPEQLAALQSTYVKQIEVITANQNAQFLKFMESMKPKTEGVPSSPAGGAGGSNDRVRRIAEKLGKTKFVELGEWTLSKTEFKDKWRRAYKEAVTSTNVPGIVFDRDVLLLPDKQSTVDIRQFVNFEPVADGADTFHWNKIGKVTFAATPDSTAITASSQTATRIAGTVVRRGALQVVGFEQGRALPFSLVEAVEATMMAAAIHDEAAHTLEQPATEASPTNWIRGDTGATVTTDDVASVTLKFDGMNKAIELLEAEGYSRSSLVAFLRPKALAELRSDAIETLGGAIEQVNSQIIQTGMIEQYLGCRIVPTTGVFEKDNTTNDAFRNIVCVSGIALGLASRDNVELETFRDIKNVETQVGGGHSIKAAVIDKSAYVRVSTTK